MGKSRISKAVFLSLSIRAAIRWTRLQMASHVCFVSTGILGLLRFGGQTNPPLLLTRNELCQDKYE